MVLKVSRLRDFEGCLPAPRLGVKGVVSGLRIGLFG